MNTRSGKRHIGIVSLGCAKNLVDSERLMRQLEADRVSLHFDPSGSGKFDSVIINTCGFIGDARQESIDHILQFVQAKQEGRVGKVFVMGCLSQRYHDQLVTEIPEVDGFFGVNEMPDVLRAAGSPLRKELLGERHLTTPSHYAYLKIAEGCDRRCSFCAIPGIRGNHVSRPEEEILEEAALLARKGVRELLVISQDTTYYGLDIYKRRKLARLLDKLAGIEGVEWIRLHYTYPHGFPMEVLEVMRSNKKICNYIDIPLQHISDRILRSMKRGMTGARTRSLVRSIRERVPGVAIRTTFIVGYPGETDKEFRELCSFIEEYEFERAGVFTYSPEENTPASRLTDDIPGKVKQARADELMELQERISLGLNTGRIGQTMKVVVDQSEGDNFIGRTEFDSPEVDNEVIIRSPVPLKEGSFHNVIITGAGPFELMADFQQD